MKINLAILIGALFCLLPYIAGANNFGQASVMSACPRGSAEAEEIYQEARKYWLGQEGYKKKPKKALELFEKAMFMGNSKAALGIGGLFMWDFEGMYDDKERLRFMLKMYNEGIKMGCAEGHVLLAECYFKGWGVPIDDAKAVEELKQAVAKGSPKGMEVYGTYLWDHTNEKDLGRELLRQSLALGNGDAGKPLSKSYMGRDDDKLYAALRNGARLGSRRCLRTLAHYYLGGEFGQEKNKKLFDCVTRIEDSINGFYAPEPIDNFGELCPHPTPLHVTP